MDLWKEVVEKASNVEVKASLQLSSKTREINSRCPKGYRPLAKKEKNKANQEHGDKDRDKAKFNNPSFANSQSQAQVSKKDRLPGGQQRGHLAIKIYATKVAKKDKDITKDLSHIECYTCKQKDHYAKNCPQKPKN